MEKLFWDGQAASRALYGACVEGACREHGLNRAELDILLFLANNPQFDTATDIVEQRCLSKAHVSQSIRTLEERGYLERRYAGDNRRTIHLRLLDASRGAVEAGRRAQQRWFSMLFEGFDDAEREQMRSFLNRMGFNARAHIRERE